MFEYQVFDHKHNLLIKSCSSLDEAIQVAKPLLKDKKVRIKKIQNEKIIREFSFTVQEGKDTLISYVDESGLVLSSPI